MNDLLEYARKTSASGSARGPKDHRREPAATQRSSTVRGNKRATGKRLSTFNIVIAVFAAGFAIVLYVNNILAVNQLAFEVNRLESRADSLSNINNVLRAAVNRKTALEQIGRIATGELQLQYLPPGEQPVLLEVDPEKVERLRQEEPRR
jgi:hypothetical protein